jgi:hypothetical protein
MAIGAVEILIFLAALGLPVWAITDAALKPREAWMAIGQNRVVWILLLAALTFAFGLGVVLAVVCLVAVRPKLTAAVPR